MTDRMQRQEHIVALRLELTLADLDLYPSVAIDTDQVSVTFDLEDARRLTALLKEHHQ